MSREQLERVIACFDEEAWPYGLSAEKIRDRARVVEVDSGGGADRIVFELERHRGILGEQYVPGMAMRNFVTEVRRYAFDSETTSIEELSRRMTDAQIDAGGVVDNLTEATLSFTIEPVNEGFHVTEVVSLRSETVESEAEFLQWARELPTTWDLTPLLEEARDYMTADEYAAFRERVVAGCQAAAEERARRAWDRYTADTD